MTGTAFNWVNKGETGATPINATNLNNIQTQLLDLFYPIGCYFETSNTEFDPNTSWGGTWEKITDGYFLESTTSIDDCGQTVEAGLPNVTFDLLRHCYWGSNGSVVYDGAIKNTLTEYKFSLTSDSSGEADRLAKTQFDASRCSSIYGNSSTVQPKSIKCFRWHRTA